MNRLTTLALFITTSTLLSACKKEVETVVKEVDRKYSWMQVKNLEGTSRIILSTGNNGQALFLQQPYFFTKYVNQSNTRPSHTSAAVPLPTDIRIQVAIAPEFTAFPASDSTLVFFNNEAPLSSKAYVELRRLDPTAVRFDTFGRGKCTAINRNNYLLAPYLNKDANRPITFLLAAVTPGTADTRVLVQPQLVRIPKSLQVSGAYVRDIAAIEDYFLVNLGDLGIYKIKQDGSFRNVYSYALADYFYKWKGTVYAPVEYNKILTSTNDGETWQLSQGTPDHFTLAEYYTVKDSLVGNFLGNIYTLNWRGTTFTSRFLKNDGLERADITGIEVLRDSVYVATTTGLFARSVADFFETKK